MVTPPRRAIVLTLVAILLIGAVPDSAEIPRGVESKAAHEVVRLLETSRTDPAARLLAYPSSYTPDELANDVHGVSESLHVLLKEFGAPSSSSPSRRYVEFYEVGVGGGPQPYWWIEQGAATRQYVYEAHFSNYGRGFVLVVTAELNGTERAASVHFGLPRRGEHSEARVRTAFNALLDSSGLPQDHPARSMPVPSWQAPPVN